MLPTLCRPHLQLHLSSDILLQLGMPRLRGTACIVANVYALMFRMVGFASLRRGQAVTQPCR